MKTAIEKLDDTELNGRRVRLIEDRRGRKFFFLLLLKVEKRNDLLIKQIYFTSFFY